MDRSSSWRNASIVGGLGLFVLASALVDARLLRGTDLVVAQWVRSHTVPLLEGWSVVVAVLLSAEVSLLFALAGCLVLKKAGLRLWALAPLAFLPAALVEVALKLTLRQPQLPSEFVRHSFYPLLNITFLGTFPSGHAVRSAFFCAFVAILLWNRGKAVWRITSIALVPVALLLGFARVYMGQHWTSDVVAGLLLGASFALMAAPPVARRLSSKLH